MPTRFEQFVTGITACYRSIQHIKSTEMTELGLKGAHVMCLYYLYHAPDGLTAAQLCRLCAEDKAAVSRTLAELEARGCISPVSGSTYRTPRFLTDAGNALAAHMNGIIQDWEATGGAGLTEADRAQFYRTLSHIASNLREKSS